MQKQIELLQKYNELKEQEIKIVNEKNKKEIEEMSKSISSYLSDYEAHKKVYDTIDKLKDILSNKSINDLIKIAEIEIIHRYANESTVYSWLFDGLYQKEIKEVIEKLKKEDKQTSNKVNINIKLEEPEYIDENTIKIGMQIGRSRMKDIIIRYNGIRWVRD